MISPRNDSSIAKHWSTTRQTWLKSPNIGQIRFRISRCRRTKCDFAPGIGRFSAQNRRHSPDMSRELALELADFAHQTWPNSPQIGQSCSRVAQHRPNQPMSRFRVKPRSMSRPYQQRHAPMRQTGRARAQRADASQRCALLRTQCERIARRSGVCQCARALLGEREAAMGTRWCRALAQRLPLK